MSHWTHHVDEQEREDLEEKALHTIASLARQAMFAGLLRKVNQHRAEEGLPPLRRPPGVRETDWEKTLNSKIDDALIAIYRMTGSPGSDVIVAVQRKYESLRVQVIGWFTG